VGILPDFRRYSRVIRHYSKKTRDYRVLTLSLTVFFAESSPLPASFSQGQISKPLLRKSRSRIRVIEISPKSVEFFFCRSGMQGSWSMCIRLAVQDRSISHSPFDLVATRWERPQTPLRRIPTNGQFEAIVVNKWGSVCKTSRAGGIRIRGLFVPNETALRRKRSSEEPGEQRLPLSDQQLQDVNSPPDLPPCHFRISHG